MLQVKINYLTGTFTLIGKEILNKKHFCFCFDLSDVFLIPFYQRFLKLKLKVFTNDSILYKSRHFYIKKLFILFHDLICIHLEKQFRGTKI